MKRYLSLIGLLATACASTRLPPQLAVNAPLADLGAIAKPQTEAPMWTQLHIHATGRESFRLFAGRGQRIFATSGAGESRWLAELDRTSLRDRADLLSGLGSEVGPLAGIGGDWPHHAVIATSRPSSRIESHEVFVSNGGTWTKAGDDYGTVASVFESPDGETLIVRENGSSSVTKVNGDKVAVLGDKVRLLFATNLEDGSVLGIVSDDATAGANKFLHWTKLGRTFVDIPKGKEGHGAPSVIVARDRWTYAVGWNYLRHVRDGAYVASWDGSAWSPVDVPTSVGHPMRAAVTQDGSLVVATTTYDAESLGQVWVRSIDGQWRNIRLPESGDGLPCTPSDLAADARDVWVAMQCTKHDIAEYVLASSEPPSGEPVRIKHKRAGAQ